RVAPSRLLAPAARRAARRAWNRLAPPLAPARDRLLDAIGCDGAASLARLLSHPRPVPTPWTPPALRAALERHAPGELERALARADAAAQGRIAVYGTVVDVSRRGGGTDWQLDPIHGGRFAAWAPSSALPDAPGLDVKMAWAIGRGEQWVALAQGAVLDRRGGGDLARALAASVCDFAVENPVGRGVHWASAMEAAIRAWNLTLAIWILTARGAPLDPELAVEAARLLVATGRFILAHLEDDFAIPNNHLTIDWLGLLACAEGLPEWAEAPRWRALALSGLAAAIEEQTNDDGTSFEGSLPYQRFSLEIFAAGAILAHAAHRPLGAAYARRLGALFRSTRTLLSSAGEIPQIGDNDSGRMLALRERGPTEGGYLLPLGAALLRDPSLLVRPGAADAVEVAWLLGPRALDALARARPGRPPGSASFPQGGFHAIRRGRLEAFVSCGRNGQRGIGGHSHNDKLALELYAGGALAVCDPGCPSYTGDPELRNAFRSTRAHATVVVDGLEQAPILPDRLFALPDVSDARVLSFEQGGPAARFAGEHRGFARSGVVHRREITVVDWGAAVVDRVAGGGEHAVELRWPFATAAARVRAVSPAEAEVLRRLAGAVRLRWSFDPAHVVEVPLGPAGALVVGFACPPGFVPEVVRAVRSPGYGQLADASTAVLAGRVPCPAALGTLFVLVPGAADGAGSRPVLRTEG
ncbi:MAG TPA: alginate lyase family protein, partial [Anaeromyxobacter sp.]|nr:alginate lyase family protein [Anaeromyxobacter sp.]